MQIVLFKYLKHMFSETYFILIQIFVFAQKKITTFDLHIVLIYFEISYYLAINMLNIEKMIMAMASLTDRIKRIDKIITSGGRLFLIFLAKAFIFRKHEKTLVSTDRVRACPDSKWEARGLRAVRWKLYIHKRNGR